MRMLISALFSAAMILPSPFDSSALGQTAKAPHASLYDDAHLFLSAIEKTKPRVLPTFHLSGVIVPHHLLAADLIARGFWLASGGVFERIIIISPDHFSKANTAFATTSADFSTVLGTVESDQRAIAHLLTRAELFSQSRLFDEEHGVQAVLPFVKYFFPHAPIVPIAISNSAPPASWDELVAILLPLLTHSTLVVQSTDFSHFLAQKKARERDQEVLNLLAEGDPTALMRLKQPAHADCIACLYVQLKTQRERFSARASVIANANSDSYLRRAQRETTSYLLVVFGSLVVTESAFRHTAKLEDVYYFAGDMFFGRYMTALLAQPKIEDAIVEAILRTTQGARVIGNLEGVTLDEVPGRLRMDSMAMPLSLTLRILNRLNVKCVSVANNHSLDLGWSAYGEMLRALRAAGITVLGQAESGDFGHFRLVALTDLSNRGPRLTELIDKTVVGKLVAQALGPPLFTFVHWGIEYASEPSLRELQVANELRRVGVSNIIGAHSHRASQNIISLAGGEAQMTFSLGNFIFDQNTARGNGALLRVRFFDQGTYFSELVTIPNLYEYAQLLDGESTAASSP